MRRERILSSPPISLGPIAGIAKVAGWGLFVWGCYWPRPYDLVVGICVLAPLLVPPLLVVGRESLSLLDEETRISLLPVLGLPAVIAALRGMSDFAPYLPEYSGPLRPMEMSLLLGAGLFVALIACDGGRERWSARQVFTAIMVAAMAFAWGYGASRIVNGLFNRGSPQVIQTVVEKRSSLDEDFKLLVYTLSEPRRTYVIEVSASDYAMGRPGSLACVAIRTGLLGWRSAHVATCPPSLSRPL